MSLEHETEWWTCWECGAQVATWAVTFDPLPPDLEAYRNPARFDSSRGGLWEKALLVGGWGDCRAMSEPRFCPGCGRKVVAE